MIDVVLVFVLMVGIVAAHLLGGNLLAALAVGVVNRGGEYMNKIRMAVASLAVAGLVTFGAVAPANAAPVETVSHSQTISSKAAAGVVKTGPSSPRGWIVCFVRWVVGDDCYHING